MNRSSNSSGLFGMIFGGGGKSSNNNSQSDLTKALKQEEQEEQIHNLYKDLFTSLGFDQQISCASMPISLSSSSVVKPSPTLSDAAAFASANPQSADPASASTTGAANTLAAAMNKETGLGDRMLHQEFFEALNSSLPTETRIFIAHQQSIGYIVISVKPIVAGSTDRWIAIVQTKYLYERFELLTSEIALVTNSTSTKKERSSSNTSIQHNAARLAFKLYIDNLCRRIDQFGVAFNSAECTTAASVSPSSSTVLTTPNSSTESLPDLKSSMAAPSSSTVESGRHPKLIYSLWQDFISIKNSSNVIVNDVSNHLQLVMTNNFDFKDLLLRSDAAPVNEPSDHIVVDILYDSFLRSDTKQAAKFATEAEKTMNERKETNFNMLRRHLGEEASSYLPEIFSSSVIPGASPVVSVMGKRQSGPSSSKKVERVDLSQIGNLIKEMVQTETNYRDGISALEEVVNVPIRVIIHSVFEKQKVNIVQSQLKDNVSNMSNRLFPDLVHLVQISTRFLDEIVNFNKNHQADVLAQLKKICSTFRSLRDDIAKNFSLYITQYEDSENILNADDEIKCRVSNEALLLVEQAREQSRLTISDFKYENVKIFPVQRLPRYITLLENCLNCLPESHANREDVEETLEVLKGVTEQINTENVMHKRQALLHNLSNVYNSHMKLFYSAVRTLMGEIDMLESALLTPDSKKKSNSTMNPMTLLLFSDHVVLFKRTALKSNVKQSSVYRHPPKPKYSYTVDTFIDLNELMVKRVEGNGKVIGFTLISKNRKFSNDTLFNGLAKSGEATPYEFRIAAEQKDYTTEAMEECDRFIQLLKHAIKCQEYVPTAHREKKNKLHMIDRNDFRVYYSLRNKEEFLNENASRMITSNSKILLVYSSAESAEDLEQERAKFKLLSENHHVWSYAYVGWIRRNMDGKFKLSIRSDLKNMSISSSVATAESEGVATRPWIEQESFSDIFFHLMMKCAKNVDAALPFFFTRNYHLYTESHLALLGAIFHDSKSNSGLVRKSSVSSFFNRSSSASISSGHIPERKKPVASDAVSFIGGLRRQLTKYEKSVVKNNKLAASAKHKDPIAGIKLDDYSPQSPLDIVIRLIHDIENRSIRLEGIYSDKAYFNMEEMGSLDFFKKLSSRAPEIVPTILKSYIYNSLTFYGKLIPPTTQDSLLKAATSSDSNKTISDVIELMKSCESDKRKLAATIFLHLKRVAMLQDKNKMSSQRLADAMAAEFFHSDRLSNANRDLAVNIVKSLIDYADFLVETDINTINSFASYAASEVSMQASVSSFYPYAAPASSSQPPIPPQPHTTPLYHSAERSTNIQSSVNDYASLTTASVVTKPFFASTGGHVVLEPLSSITEEEPEFTTRISMPNTIPVTQLPGKAVEFDVDKFLMSQKPLLPHDGTGMQAIHEEEDGADAFNIIELKKQKEDALKLFKERLDDIKSSSLETLVNEIDYLKMNILVEISKNAFTAASSNTAKSVVIDNNEEEVVEEKKDVDEKKEEGAITKSITDNTEAIAVIDEVSATTTSSCVSPDNDDETHLASKELDSGVLTPTPFLIKQESGLYSESLPPVFGGENGEIESAINKRSMVALLGGGLSPNNSSDDLLALKKELMPQASIATISAPDQEQQNEQADKKASIMQLFAEAAEPTIVMQQQSSAITLNLPIMASESSILDLNNTSISKSLSVIENVHNKVFSDLHRSLEDMQDPEDGLLGTRFDLALEDAFKTVSEDYMTVKTQNKELFKMNQYLQNALKQTIGEDSFQKLISRLN